MIDECIRNGYSYNPGHFIPGVAGIGVALSEPVTQRTLVIHVALLSQQILTEEARTRAAATITKHIRAHLPK